MLANGFAGIVHNALVCHQTFHVPARPDWVTIKFAASCVLPNAGPWAIAIRSASDGGAGDHVFNLYDVGPGAVPLPNGVCWAYTAFTHWTAKGVDSVLPAGSALLVYSLG